MSTIRLNPSSMSKNLKEALKAKKQGDNIAYAFYMREVEKEKIKKRNPKKGRKRKNSTIRLNPKKTVFRAVKKKKTARKITKKFKLVIHYTDGDKETLKGSGTRPQAEYEAKQISKSMGVSHVELID